MLIAQQVPDDVWAALPARRLPRWRVLGSVVLVAALVSGAYAAAQAGVLAPNLRAESYGGSWTEGSGSFTTVTTLTNDGAVPVTIESAAVGGSTWLRLDRVTLADRPSSGDAAAAAFPVTLGAHEGVSVELWFTVTDCSRVDRVGLPLTVQASSPRGTTTVDITPAGQQDPGAPGSYSYSGADPWEVPWPGSYAAAACSVPLPPRVG